MSYADQRMSGSKVVAIVIVALIHAVIGYAFVTGLAYQYVKKAAEKLNTFDVEEPPPPPPDEPPPPPPDTPLTPPPVVSPPPIVNVPRPPVVMQTVTTPPPAAPMVPIAAPPAPPPPAPAPPRIAVPVTPRGNQGDWFPQDSYPAAARRAEAEGRVSVQVTVDTRGRVSACRVTSSSGNSDLDEATCRLATRNGRFNPAKDANGTPIESTTSIRAVKWQIEDR
ncbi:energy transducer TonB [Sphingomonas alpina]|uniref:TonB family protein n=1 Tax=Sphingomonas alpina TaxID=653931 RepID=A0A7H0LLX9_9SPHN|nr:energy transducer TonB [Sphingomonas alpina]QNQ10682.1 TonB family protein [Sphingomonas alpina]